MIPKNTSVLIRRVPGRPRKTIVADRVEQKVVECNIEDLPAPSSMLVGDSSTMKYTEESEWDGFGNDLYAMPEVTQARISNPVLDFAPADNVDEDSKIKALIETPALYWNRQSQDAYGGGRGFGWGMGGRMVAGRGFGRGGLESKTPPARYVCHRCKVPGHFIRHCPTNGDSNYDIRRVKPPTGIPKSMLVATRDGSYASPSGAVAVLKPNEAAFDKEVDGLPTTRLISEIPSELCCPLCKEVMKDAVLTSTCCFRSYCDKCIRDYIISKAVCICGATDILADHLLPNKTVRETITKMLEATTNSTENIGSQVHVQDVESAHPAPPRVLSPTLSAVSKDETRQSIVEQSPNMKDGEVAVEFKIANVEINSKEMVSERASVTEATKFKKKERTKSAESAPTAPVPEDTQEKQVFGEQAKKMKKKKAHLPGSAADMQWKAYQDLGPENYPGMPYPALGFNPYWTGGIPMGMDGYMGHFRGPMPCMGYQPSPFDGPFGGGIFQQDPFAGQGYVMPVLPRDVSELGMGNMGMNQGHMGMNQGHPPFSREEIEARRAKARYKREMEQHGDLERRGEMQLHSNREWEQSKDRDPRRDSRSISDVSSIKTKRKSTSNMERPNRSERSSRLDRHVPSHHSNRKTTATIATDQDNILFDDGNTSKKRKSSSSEILPMPNGLKEHHRNLSTSRKGEDSQKRKSGKSSLSRMEGKSGEEEHHFKRRASSSRRGEDEWPPASSRWSRAREVHERGRQRPSKAR